MSIKPLPQIPFAWADPNAGESSPPPAPAQQKVLLFAVYGHERRPRCYGAVGTHDAGIPRIANYKSWTARQQHVYHHARRWFVIVASNAVLGRAKAVQALEYVTRGGARPATLSDVLDTGRNVG